MAFEVKETYDSYDYCPGDGSVATERTEGSFFQGREVSQGEVGESKVLSFVLLALGIIGAGIGFAGVAALAGLPLLSGLNQLEAGVMIVTGIFAASVLSTASVAFYPKV